MSTPHPENPEPADAVLTTKAILEKELEQIAHQRSVRFSGEGAPKPPADGKDFVGMCFSGGGIRSATLNLGILQGMREFGLLKHVDYLSTVSGGGYIGSWFCATRYRLKELLTRKGGNAKHQALQEEASALLKDDRFLDESASPKYGSRPLRHLRQFSRYLAPKDGITSGDTWTMAAVWLRNTFLIQLMVLALIFAIISALQILPVAFKWLVIEGGPPESFSCREWTEHWPWVAALLLQVAAVAMAAKASYSELKVVRQGTAEERVKARAFPAAGWITGCLTLAAFLGGTQIFRTFALGAWFPMHANPWKDGVVNLFALVLAVLSVAMMYQTTRPAAWKNLNLAKQCAYWVGGVIVLWTTVMTIIWALAEIFQWVAVVRAKGPLLMLTSDALAWSSVISIPVLLLGYGTMMVLAAGILGRYSEEKSLEWMARAGAWILMATALITLAVFIAIAGPVWLDWLWDTGTIPQWIKNTIIGGWVSGTVAAVLVGKSEKTNGKSGGLKEKLLGCLPLLMLAGLLLALSWLVRWAYVKSFSLFLSFTAILRENEILKVPSPRLLERPTSFLLDHFSHHDLFGWHWLLVTGIAGIVGLLLLWRVDLNQFSMNPFYRNRLTRCYLGGSRLDPRCAHGATGFDIGDLEIPGDDLKMEVVKHGEVPYGGPFHIVNMAVNTGASAGNDVQDRSAESFAMTALHSGFDHARHAMPLAERDPEGLCEHRSWYPTHSYGSGWTLGQALSVSGAAASPNSGYHTSPLVAFMLTLFNARLGWWAPHPGCVAFRNLERPRWTGFFGCLFSELTGSASLRSDFVYLSDGGHFENLGLYELVRRGCRFIIVGDGECDPDYHFHALGTAVRRCKVDFGVTIDIDTRDIQPDATTGLSRSYAAFGTITYPENFDLKSSVTDRQGILIYLKSSITGNESLAVKQFRSANPTFPHESTGDQFFSESQFESYRELGRHIARQVFRPVASLAREATSSEPIEKWFKRLSDFWRPPPRLSSTAFINHSEALTAIWRETLRDSDLTGFDQVLMPEWTQLTRAISTETSEEPGKDEKPETPLGKKLRLAATPARKAAYLSQEIIQLMENVFLDLDLHHDADHKDHRGWLELFKHWAAQPAIRDAWQHSYHLFGERFEHFCEQVLRMPVDDKNRRKEITGGPVS